MIHNSLARGQELATADQVDKGTPETTSANRCHTEHHTQRGRPS